MMLAAVVFGAQAQTVTKPKEFYFDADASTVRRIVVVEGEGEALAADLVKARERGRRQMEATAQLGHVALSDNRVELGKSLYEQAVAGTAVNSSVGRSIRWNYAWDLYHNGDFAQAFGLWN
ncbi:MAG TPA: tetratricopeptide repeat protein, partial [Pseudoxanthomonas sp.]|nr:tetratricopeptide repeat protein [Pseudoxanthomonas sp.]